MNTSDSEMNTFNALVLHNKQAETMLMLLTIT